MPWEIVKDTNACPADKPFAVRNIKTGDVNGRCHATRESARQQQKLLYAKLDRGEIKMAENYLVPLAFSEPEDNLLWLEAMPAKTWHTPLYGEVPITEEKLQRMIKNFHDGVRGQEIPTDYEHGRDSSKGTKASGWFRDVELHDGSLWVGVELTPTARKEIEDGEWKYFSLQWFDEWQHPETQQVHQDVIVGGGFTNNPVAKGLVPINFSELYQEIDFAETKKPYGNVTYADPGYQSDNKKRYPLDTPDHVRAAWSYINMPRNAKKYSSSQLAAIKAKIRAAMNRIGATVKQMSELAEEAKALSESAVVELEHRLEEHSEPGTGIPPQPLVEPIEKDAETGSRRESPPAAFDPEDNMENELRELLALDEDADVLEAVKELHAKAEPLIKAEREFSERKSFAEMFPEEHRRMQMLEEKDLKNEAKAFAESVARFTVEDGDARKPTGKGYSQLVVDKIESFAKAFSERNATLNDLREILEAIPNGIVDYTEHGSSRVPATTLTETGDPKKAFSELVASIAEKDEVPWEKAIEMAAKQDPDLFKAYDKAASAPR